MKKLALPLAILAALCFVGLSAAPADAASFSIRIGGDHGHHGGHHGIHGSHGRIGNAYSCNRGRGYVWHDTSHLDWHPASFRWHGNHFDYVPGHYDVHHTGHWDHLHW